MRLLSNSFLSPRRPRDKKKTTASAHRPGRSAHLQQIQIFQRHHAGSLNTTNIADDGDLNEIVMDDVFSETWNDETL